MDWLQPRSSGCARDRRAGRAGHARGGARARAARGRRQDGRRRRRDLGHRSAAATSRRTAVDRARELLAERTPDAGARSTSPSPTRRPSEHGVQCCGGEVTMLLEPLAVVPAVAIFGVGHVGLELARILARHDLELHLVDSRADQLAAGAPRGARRRRRRRPRAPRRRCCPSSSSASCRAGTHVLVMTHDHAEDAALCDAALRSRRPRLDRADRLGGEVGAVPHAGSPPRATTREALARITTPDRPARHRPARSRPRSR